MSRLKKRHSGSDSSCYCHEKRWICCDGLHGCRLAAVVDAIAMRAAAAAAVGAAAVGDAARNSHKSVDTIEMQDEFTRSTRQDPLPPKQTHYHDRLHTR